MATRAATFTAKIRNLKDYHSRIVNSVLPLPNGTDIANTLKYFSQTLIGVLKDVPMSTKELFVRRRTDRDCLQVFPELDYLHLYETVVSIIDAAPFITTGQHALGESLLGVIGCLAPFLSSQILDTLPCLVASTLTSFPASLHRDILMLLCTNLLPITLAAQTKSDGFPSYVADSIPSILMIVFQFAVAKEYHSMIVECLMSLKKDVFTDLMCIIAYGTSAARGPAAHLLFYFWPQLTPIHFDRTGLHGTYIGFEFSARGTILCQKSKCLNNRCVAAVKSCLDPRLVQDTTVLPIHMCQSCVDELPKDVVEQLYYVVRRIERMELYCENEECFTKNVDQKMAICTCFSVPCILFNDQRPMRLCEECHLSRHEPDSNHIFHLTPPSLWTADPNLRVLLVDSIVSLLKETENLEDKRLLEMGDERGRLHLDEDADGDHKKLLSRYGVWLLVQLVPVKNDISFEILGHLLSALFHWFDATTYLKDNVVGNALDRLKSKYLCQWMDDILENHGDIVTACLLPHPLECFKVASCYDAMSSRTLQIKEGLNQLLCLIPFNVISLECWNYIMPFWLESIRSEVLEHDLSEFKILLRKLFDMGLNASSFKSEEIFQFALFRFKSTNHEVQLQTLSWLQILTDLQVFISIEILVEMFMLGTTSLQKVVFQKVSCDKPETNLKTEVGEDDDEKDEEKEKDADDPVDEVHSSSCEEHLKCYLIMLDVLLKQIEIQDVEPHREVNEALNQTIIEMLSSMITILLDETILIGSSNQITLHLLCNKLITFIVSKSPKMPVENGPVSVVDQELIENGSMEFNLSALPPQHRLLFHFSELIGVVSNIECKYLCLTSMYLLCQHSDFLRMQKNLQERNFFKHFSADLALPGLWNMLTSEHNQASSSAVSLLIYFLTFPFSVDVFGNLIENNFSNNSWNVRFKATEKVAVVASCLTEEKIGTNEYVRSSLAHAFYHLIGSLDDVNSSIAVKAALLIESMSIKALKGMCLCLEHHFDLLINDRTLILNKLKKLSTVLLNSNKNPSILSWDFFFNKLDVLCLEAQIGLENVGEIAHLEDLHHSDLLGDYFLEKATRARAALMRSSYLKSFKKCSTLNIGGGKPLSTLLVYSKQLAPLRKDQKKSAYVRQQSAPLYRGRGSRFGAGLFTNLNAQVCGNLREFTDGENNLMCLLQKIIAFEDLDRETLHHLIDLFMSQLMLNSEDENDTEPSKSLSNLLWHVSLFLGYNVSEKVFTIPPYKLRTSVVFNAYISGLAKVLDRNFKLGSTMLPFALDILQYCPSPQRYASDYQPPNYSLWYLEPYVRISWLQSLLVILYKYSYSNSEVIMRLIKITINTIDARFHQCKRKEEAIILPSPYLQRNRDTSNVSVGDLENILEIETPPGSNEEEVMSSPAHSFTPQTTRRSAAILDQMASGFHSPTFSRSSSPVLSKSMLKSAKVDDGWRKRKDEGGQHRSEDDQARRIAEYKIPFDSEESTFSAMKMRFQKGDGILLKNLSHSKSGASKHEGHKDSETSSIILDASELLSKNLHSNVIDVVNEREGLKNGESKSLRCDDYLAVDNKTFHDDASKHGKTPIKAVESDTKGRKSRKTGLGMVQLVNEIPELNTFISEHISSGRTRRSEMQQKHSEEPDPRQKQGSCSRSTDNLLVDQCPSCSTPLECYDEETVSTAIVCLATFIHREPVMAASLLPNMFLCVSRIAANSPFLWQSEQVGVVIPGNSMSTARQFLRCVLHQLAPNNVFPQLFTSIICDNCFLSVLASTLADFSELNCPIALQLILEGLNEMRTLTNDQLTNAVVNLSNFMDHLILDSTPALISLFEGFFRKISILIPSPFNHVNSLLKIIISILKMPAISSVKSILEPFSKVLSFTIQNCSFRLQLLMDICSLCGRAFTKERDKFYLSRSVVAELVQTIRFKQVLPDENFVLLVQMMCLDAGGTLGPINIVKELASYTFNPHSQTLVSTNVADCLKMHLSDCIEFIADIHTTNKLKTNTKGAFQNLNEDTLGSHLKVGIAQFVALEFSYSSGKDGRLVARYLPWLFHPPSAIQQGPREFVDCICHVRILCWLLLSSLMHSAVTGAAGAIVCRPLTMECCGYIADHIMVILTGFSGQSKTSVLHMSSLFHAFMLCQLWTMYCELQDILDMPLMDDSTAPHQTIIDFWGKVTPGILQLLSHSKVMSEMVNLHFLSLMEALQECNSTVLVKLFSLWVPILRSYHSQLPGHMQVRLQMCQNWRPSKSSKEPKIFCEMLAKWIKRMQFKLSQIEVQSSTATQFYAV